jgi:hypothetical protein
MSIEIVRTAIGAAALSLSLTPASAQQGSHQLAGMAQAPGSSAAVCAQNSAGVTRAIDAVNGRIEDARQTNDASKLRAAIADLQVVLAQMKTQLADCVALGSEAGGGALRAMPGMDQSKMAAAPAPKTSAAEPSPMAGMDHSKMGADKGAAAGATTSSKPAQAPSVVFTLRTQPAPPRSGKNDFEVSVKDANGKPIADAEVSLAFYMVPLPSRNVPEMRTTVKLASAGHGIYKGSATLGMAGDWDVTVIASRNGHQLDAKKMKVTAR